jgi:hypothetical protein
MNVPLGFVALREAADMVGQKVNGADWRGLDEVEKADVWLDPQIGAVITMLAEACERGEIAATYEAPGPPEPLPRREWQSPYWRSFFTTGRVTLDLPLLGINGQPAGRGTARCPRNVFVRRDDLECFVGKLAAFGHPETQPPEPSELPSAAGEDSRPGRPPHDWASIETAARELMEHHGDFGPDNEGWTAPARLVEQLCDRFSIGKTQLRERLPNILSRWRSDRISGK